MRDEFYKEAKINWQFTNDYSKNQHGAANNFFSGTPSGFNKNIKILYFRVSSFSF
jgi:hypothetical protein